MHLKQSHKSLRFGVEVVLQSKCIWVENWKRSAEKEWLGKITM